MVEKFLEQTTFTSQEDFIKNLKIKIPENFNFGYDIVDAWAAEEPDKKALLWTNDKGEHIQYTYADLKKYTDMTASYFQSLGIGHGDMVMLILKRRYEFWYSIIALHKLGAVVIPATHLLTKKDIVYRCNAADIKMIVAAGEDVITKHIIDAMPDCPSVKKLVSVGPDIPEGFEDFHKGIEKAAPFVKPDVRKNHLEDTQLYSREFYADQVSYFMANAKIPVRLRPAVEKLRNFLFGPKGRSNQKQRTEAAKRRENFLERARDFDWMTAEEKVLYRVAICTLVEARNTTVDDLFYGLFGSGEEEMDARMEAIRTFNLEPVLWALCRERFGYEEANPSLDRFILSLFVVTTCRDHLEKIHNN